MIEKERLVAMVRGLQEGDTEAATQLYETFREDIYYFILKTVNNDRELAEDLTQDTFVEILETVDKLQEPAAFVTWSKQIAYHKCTAYFRKRKELLADENEDGYSVFDTIEEENEEFIPDAALEKEDLKNTIAAMINELPEEQKSALVLRYFNEVSVKEIAQIQGVTEGTVKSRLNYGRKAIKQSVEAYEKKNGIKLRCVGIVPLLLWLFRQYRLAGGISLTTQTAETAGFLASGTAASSSAAGAASSSSTASAAAKTGIKIGSKVISQKVIAGVAAGVVALGGVTAGVLAQPEESGNVLQAGSIARLVSQDVTHIYFVEQEIPDNVQTIDVSAEWDNSVVVWIEGDSAYVAARDGGKIYTGEDCSYLFSLCYDLETIDLSGLDTSNATNMERMFSECYALKEINFGDWNISNVESVYRLFDQCHSLETLDLSDWDVSNVTVMSGMFYDCDALRQLDLSSWDTSNVTDMSGMFAGCTNLVTLDISSFDVSNVQYFGYDSEFPYSGFDGMFYDCPKLTTIYASDWTSQIGFDPSSTKYMFEEAVSLVGAVAFSDDKIGFDMANTDGYFTQK